MKRDMELIRKILLKIEEEFVPGEGLKSDFKIDGYDYIEVGEHCELIYQAGLIRDFKTARGSDNKLLYFKIGPLTNKGHDYLELIRSDQVWIKTNEEVKKKNLPETIETIGKIAGAIIGTFMREYNR